MASDDQLDELLSRWEALRRREGRDVAARELWPDASPEELAERERQLQDQRFVRAIIDPPVPAGPPADPVETLHVSGYELVQPLGKGGFGQVWKARRTGGHHPYVALKIVHLNQEAVDVEKAALEVMKDLHHLHIVPMSAAWTADGRLLIEMELADRTLWDLFSEAKAQGRPGIDGDDLLGYLDDAALGIDWLNADVTEDGRPKCHIFHRDIKPKNLLLLGKRVKVADFGVCRASQHALTGHTRRMSAPYAAPEFFNGETHERSDQ